MPSETQRILTPAGFGVLGFAISIFTNQLLKLGILCIRERFSGILPLNPTYGSPSL